MKAPKWRLFTGIFLLTLGIVLRVASSMVYPPLILVFLGVGFKVWHISSLILQKKYQPGKECWFLLLGLILFFSGLYFMQPPLWKYSFMVSGILLKIYFVVQLIRKTKH